jgi:hypothetical protein
MEIIEGVLPLQKQGVSVQTKCCTRCFVTKATTEFYKSKRGKFGVEAICKSCSALKYKNNRDHILERNKERYKENREEILQKNKEYRQANREAVAVKDSERKKRYRREHREECLTKDALTREKNAEKIKQYKDKYARDNQGVIAERRRTSYQKSKDEFLRKQYKWAEENKEKVRGYKRKWSDLNPHKRRAGRIRRRQLLKHANPIWANDEFSDFLMQEMYLLAKLRSQLTDIEWQVDHKVPIVSDIVCGLHCPDNLQVIPASLNLEKSNLFWEDMP